MAMKGCPDRPCRASKTRSDSPVDFDGLGEWMFQMASQPYVRAVQMVNQGQQPCTLQIRFSDDSGPHHISRRLAVGRRDPRSTALVPIDIVNRHTVGIQYWSIPVTLAEANDWAKATVGVISWFYRLRMRHR